MGDSVGDVEASVGCETAQDGLEGGRKVRPMKEREGARRTSSNVSRSSPPRVERYFNSGVSAIVDCFAAEDTTVNPRKPTYFLRR